MFEILPDFRTGRDVRLSPKKTRLETELRQKLRLKQRLNKQKRLDLKQRLKQRLRLKMLGQEQKLNPKHRLS